MGGTLDLFTRKPPKSMKNSSSKMVIRFPKLRLGVTELIARHIVPATKHTNTSVRMQ
jgi:hypothetical protein